MFYPADLKATLEANFGKGSARRSFLRQEAVLKNSSSSALVFDYKSNKGLSSPAERKLDENDLFVATGLGMYLLREARTEKGFGVLRTHVAATDFADATVNGKTFKANHLELLYNSWIKAEVDGDTIYEAIETQDFRKVPGEYMPNTGKIVLTPRLIFRGHAKNALTLVQPEVDGLQWESVTENVENKVVLYAYGFQVLGKGKAPLQLV